MVVQLQDEKIDRQQATQLEMLDYRCNFHLIPLLRVETKVEVK